jgi:hypothetical protein
VQLLDIAVLLEIKTTSAKSSDVVMVQLSPLCSGCCLMPLA